MAFTAGKYITVKNSLGTMGRITSSEEFPTYQAMKEEAEKQGYTIVDNGNFSSEEISPAQTNQQPVQAGQSWTEFLQGKDQQAIESGLNAAYQRQQEGTANETDKQNIEYATGKGWQPMQQAAQPIPSNDAEKLNAIKTAFPDRDQNYWNGLLQNWENNKDAIMEKYNKAKQTGQQPDFTGKAIKETAEPEANQAEAPKAMQAVYLGGAGVPYTIVEGTTKDEIVKKATMLGINPANLYGEGFKDISTIPTAEESETQSRQKAHDIINSDPNLSAEMKAVYNRMVDIYPADANLDTQSILNAFQQIKETTIDPYFAEQVSVIQQQAKNDFKILEEARAIETQTEGLNFSDAIKQAKANLEATGKTFTGEAIGELGTESAYTDKSNAERLIELGVAVPEGSIAKKQNIITSSSAAKYRQQIANFGLSLESQLGSGTDVLANAGITGYNQLGGLKGTLATQKEQRLGQTLTDLAQQGFESNRLQENKLLKI